jgi:hypothetical protein
VDVCVCVCVCVCGHAAAQDGASTGKGRNNKLEMEAVMSDLHQMQGSQAQIAAKFSDMQRWV